MAETLRILYDHTIYARPLTSMDTPVSTATASTGYEVARAFDGSRFGQWVVPTPGSTVECRFGRGATHTLGGTGSPALGVGIANHNLHTCGLDSIDVAASSSGTGGAYSTLYTLPAIGSDRDHIYRVAEGVNARSYRITFNFGSAPAVPMRVGLIVVGSMYTFERATTIGEPDYPIRSTLIEDTTTTNLASGGVAAVARPNAAEIVTFAFTAATKDTRDALRSIFVASRGPLYPIMLHTDEHGGAGDTWVDAGGSPNISHGGAYVARFGDSQLSDTQSEDRYSLEVTVRREREVYVV